MNDSLSHVKEKPPFQNRIGLGNGKEKAETFTVLQKISQAVNRVFVDFYLWFASFVSEDAKQLRNLRQAVDVFKEVEKTGQLEDQKFITARKAFIAFAKKVGLDGGLPADLSIDTIEQTLQAMDWSNADEVSSVNRMYQTIDDKKMIDQYSQKYRAVYDLFQKEFINLRSEVEVHSLSIFRVMQGMSANKKFKDGATEFAYLINAFYMQNRKMIDALKNSKKEAKKAVAKLEKPEDLSVPLLRSEVIQKVEESKKEKKVVKKSTVAPANRDDIYNHLDVALEYAGASGFATARGLRAAYQLIMQSKNIGVESHKESLKLYRASSGAEYDEKQAMADEMDCAKYVQYLEKAFEEFKQSRDKRQSPEIIKQKAEALILTFRSLAKSSPGIFDRLES